MPQRSPLRHATARSPASFWESASCLSPIMVKSRDILRFSLAASTAARLLAHFGAAGSLAFRPVGPGMTSGLDDLCFLVGAAGILALAHLYSVLSAGGRGDRPILWQTVSRHGNGGLFLPGITTDFAIRTRCFAILFAARRNLRLGDERRMSRRFRTAPHTVCQRPGAAEPAAVHIGAGRLSRCFLCQRIGAISILQPGRYDLYALVGIVALRLAELIGLCLRTRRERHHRAGFAHNIRAALGAVQPVHGGQFSLDVDFCIHEGRSRTNARPSRCIQRGPHLGIRSV